MSRQSEIKTLTERIESAFAANAFPNYIEYIRFPFYKNLKENARIDFNFPFTVLTGVNGSGKSSALHAIFGAPAGYSTGQFWFSTSVDPIDEAIGNPNAFIYCYKNGSDALEVLKTRIGTSKGADYWEPSRPLKKYGMRTLRGGRNPGIKKDVIYLDFRAELSAFDKYFYFSNFISTKTLKSKQDVLRKYSRYVKRAIDSGSVHLVNKRRNKPLINLSPAEIQTIANVLGKSYQQCKLLIHNFYGQEGATVYYTTENLNYSEAFAGRGEYAVVKLVHEVSKAQTGTLLILDEPEVSLHPGAQEQLKIYLLQACLTKKLQIVISTHSHKLVEFLPDKAIKLFYEDTDRKFEIKNSCSYHEAFHSIGIDLLEDNKNLIVVEDSTAKLITESIITELGGSYPLLFKVAYYPGGAEDIYKRGATYSEEVEVHKFLLLDGDKSKPKFDPTTFSVSEVGELAFLKSKIKTVTNIDFEKLGFRIDGNSDGGNNEQKKTSAIKYLEYLWANLEYLPGRIPEEIIWNETFASGQITHAGGRIPVFSTDFKRNFQLFAETFFGDASEASMTSCKKLLIKDFIKRKDQHYKEIVNILVRFRNSFD